MSQTGSRHSRSNVIVSWRCQLALSVALRSPPATLSSPLFKRIYTPGADSSRLVRAAGANFRRRITNDARHGRTMDCTTKTLIRHFSIRTHTRTFTQHNIAFIFAARARASAIDTYSSFRMYYSSPSRAPESAQLSAPQTY